MALDTSHPTTSLGNTYQATRFRPSESSIPSDETGTLFAVGVHPLEAGLPIDWDVFDNNAAQENCRAIGECGIDTSAKKLDVNQHKSVLAKQFRMARK